MNSTSTQIPPDLPERTEVAIIGAGIAGCATAYFLAKAGVPVVVLEKGRIAGEQSSRNWGWVRKQGRDPRELPAIIESLKIWPEFESELEADIGWKQAGVTYVATDEAQMARFEEWLGFAKPYQLDSRLLTPKETDDLLGTSGERYLGALHTPSDGRAEPSAVVPAIARAIERLGGRVIDGCAVRTLDTQAGRVAGIVTEHGRISCGSVVCAAGAWSSLFNRNHGIALPQLRVCSSVMRTNPAPLVTQSATWCGEFAFRRRQDGGYTIAGDGGSTFEIVPDAFRYFLPFLRALRMSRKDLRIRFSTSEFFRQLRALRRWGPDDVTPFERTRVLDPTPDAAVLSKALEAARATLAGFKDIQMAESWAGMIDVTPDLIPVLCAVDRPQGYYIATGFSGHGFGLGPGAGLLMSELITTGKARVDLTDFRLGRFFDGTKMIPYAPI
ncbi:MAG TPA: FAD-binding oxidoreductase [Alphaproteobacteria bacterium]|nr:FAD-binding oxidoreductase [Alphaproteobacteria bacterium]